MVWLSIHVTGAREEVESTLGLLYFQMTTGFSFFPAALAIKTLFPSRTIFSLLIKSTIWQCLPKTACFIKIHNVLYPSNISGSRSFQELIVTLSTSPDSPQITACFMDFHFSSQPLLPVKLVLPSLAAIYLPFSAIWGTPGVNIS